MALYFIPRYQVPNEKFSVLSNDDVTNMNALSNLSGQLRQLTSLLELPPEELDARRTACAEILQILRKFYPDSSLLMFGSSVNSFGAKGCDLDLLFLPFPSYCSVADPKIKVKDEPGKGKTHPKVKDEPGTGKTHPKVKDEPGTEKTLPKVKDEPEVEKTPIPDPAAVLSGEVSKDELYKLDEYNHLKFMRAVLRREKVGKRANFVPAPRCPVLRVVLNSNKKLICDISASNRLVVFNSELLQFLEKLDERVKPLVICLRYWARSLGFIKRSFFSSYSFTLLIIFFLQSASVLPSVRQLIAISGIRRMTAGWETAFTTDAQKVPKSKNNQTVGELFTQFFDYYFHFDFLRYVVSPHIGKPLPVDELKNSKDARLADFEIGRVNIQDVFILSRNVCKMEKLAIFKLALLAAHEQLKGQDKMEFRTLYDPTAYQRLFDGHYHQYMSSRPTVSFIHLDHELTKKFDSLQMWYEKASEAVYEVLQYGMLMECEVTDMFYKRKVTATSYTRSSSNKENRFSNSSMLKNNSTGPNESTPYDLQLLISIQCVLYSRTWIGRKNVQVTSMDSQDDLEVFTDSVLENEYCISKSLVKKNPLLSSPVPVLCFKCDCYKHVNQEFKDLVIMLKPLSVSREFYQVSAFLSSFLPKTVKKILTSSPLK